jgi:hypothetical protein
VDLIPSNTFDAYGVDDVSHPQGFTSLDLPGQQAMAIDALAFEQYHDICDLNLSHRQTITISTDITVNLGGVIACSSSDQLQDWAEVASLPDVEVHCSGWHGADGEVLEDGWTRYFIRFTWEVIYANHVYSSFNTSEVLNKTLWARMACYGNELAWLPQANHIFSRLQIVSNFQDYRRF